MIDPGKLAKTGGSNSSLLDEYQRRLRLVRQSDQEEDVEEKQHEANDSKSSTDRDSGVDVNEESNQEQTGNNAPTKSDSHQSATNPALELQNWILKCFADEVPQQPPSSADDEAQETQEDSYRTLDKWYETPIHYYEMTVSDEQLEPVLLEESSELRKSVDDLLPHLPLPKTLRSLPIPWIHASSVKVLAETDEPPPVHPSLVQAAIEEKSKGGDSSSREYFFKPADNTQPQPTKREIDLLYKIHSRGLSSKFNVPEIHAIVQHQNSNIEAMGFLLTAVEDPVPLTKLLDSEVDESKREKWAKETQRIIGLLHEEGIVWGDAKADNFLVDKNNELWVIDFGGSYTEGWVDPELNETVEGDDMGVDKIVSGLLDPDTITCDPDAGLDGPEGVDLDKEDDGEENAGQQRKRSRQDSDDDSEDNVEDGPDARRKKSKH